MSTKRLAGKQESQDGVGQTGFGGKLCAQNKTIRRRRRE